MGGLAACGGNPLYLAELLRAADRGGRPLAALEPAELLAGGLDGIARQVIIQVLRFRDGLHASFNLMFDRLLMLEQLGLVPASA